MYIKDKQADLIWLFPGKREESKSKGEIDNVSCRCRDDIECQGHLQQDTGTASCE